MRNPRLFFRTALSRMILLCLAATAAWLHAPQNSASAEPRDLKSLDAVVAGLQHFTVTGTVLDASGMPVSGTEVYLYYARGESGLRDRLAGRTRTRADGAFRFPKALVWEPQTETGRRDSVPRYFLIASHASQGVEFATLVEGDPIENVTIRLEPAKTWRVAVVDSDGKPVAGARVQICDAQHKPAISKELDRNHRSMRLHRDIGFCSGETDQNGVVQLVGPAHEVTFHVFKKGYAQGWWRDRITICPSARVAGRVTLEDGTPVPGAAVWFEYSGDRLGYDDVTVSNADGRYDFADVPGSGFRFGYMGPDQQKGAQGTAMVRVDDLRPGSPYISKKEAFPIQPGDNIEKNIVLTRAYTLAGKVVDWTTGKPVAGMNLNRYVQVPGSPYLDTVPVKTGPNGEFRVKVAPGSQVSLQWQESREGDYLMDQEWLRDGHYQPIEPLTMSSDRTDLVLKVKLWQGQPLTGRVVSETGGGVKGVQVHLHPDSRWVTTDSEGAFRVKVAPTDRDFGLLAITEDKSLAGYLPCKAGAAEATIPLKPTCAYEGQVLNTQGLPAPNLKFYLDLNLNGQSNLWVRWEPKTDAEGRFRVPNLVPGLSYHAWWSSDNEENRDYDFGSATVDLARLKPGEPIAFQAKQYINAVLGRVVNEKGEAVSGAKIEVRSSDLVQQNEREKKIESNKNGEFTVERLAGGEVLLHISAAGYRSLSIKSPSDNVDLEVLLKATAPGAGVTCGVTVTNEEGKPLAGVPVAMHQELYGKDGASTRTYSAVTDKRGAASFAYTVPESARVARTVVGCEAHGFDRTYQQVASNEDLDMAVMVWRPGAAWRGRVVNPKGEAIPNARVSVTGMRPGEIQDYRAHAMFSRMLSFIYSGGRDGRFDLKGFSRKDLLNIEIEAEGYVTLQKYLDPKEDKEGEERTFALAPGACVRGKVVASEGQLPPNLRLLLLPKGGNRGASGGKVGPDGVIRVMGIEPGEYVVRVYPEGEEGRKWVCAERPLINAKPGESLEVTLHMERGTPVKGRLVRTGTSEVPPGDKSVLADQNGETVAGAPVSEDGAWELYLAEGEYDLRGYCRTGTKQSPGKTTPIKVVKNTPLEGIVVEVE